jgi:class 3 adenylate cyclase
MSSDRPPGRLLVVDDNRVNRLLLAHGLEQDGHIVATAENGRQAMEMLRAAAYDLVLLDIEMPEMNGFEVLEALLKDPNLREMPVIMTSASDELDRVVKCIEMGAEDYLTKPLNPILLRARVNASLEKKRLRDQQRSLFRTFATPEVAEELLQKGFTLGGKHVKATAMFADIRSFTTIAESQDPADTIELLNDYFTLMFDAISSNGGTLNQMVGDGIMAVFGAPIFREDHRARAALAALDMIENLELFNLDRTARGRAQIKIGIGIATGRMIAGYTGTQHRAFYTCVGDTVNLAARIEDHTKSVPYAILIDQYTFEGLPPKVQAEKLGPVLFKGKQQPINIFTIHREKE